MGRKSEDEADEKAPTEPVEPNGFELTKKRKSQKDTWEKMQGTADEITRLLQEEQRRQAKYHGDRNAAGD